jgi:Ca2+-binding RTX toxin-like protein
LPLTLDLTTLGQDLAAMGLEAASVIVDSQGSSPLDIAASGAIDLGIGINLSSPTTPSAALLAGTGASFDIRAVGSLLNFKALFGAMEVSISEGSFTLDKDGDDGTSDAANYTVNLNGNQPFADAFASTSVTLTGAMDADLPLEFPAAIVPIPRPSEDPYINLSVGDASDPAGSTTINTNLDGSTWPTLSSLIGNLSLEDNLDGFKLGFDELFTKLDDLLDTAVFGQELPLVGTQLTEAADFIDQIRSKVSDNLALLSDILTPGMVRQTLFDALGPGGLDWLVDRNLDGYFNAEDDIGLTASASEVIFDLDLLMPQQLLEIPVDVDLLLPGLGLEADALAEVKFGFSMPLVFGMSLTEGMFIDVSESNELIIELEVALPIAVATLRGNPKLTFKDNSPSDPDTITRDEGSWVLDGFNVGHVITVDGSGQNDGEFVIASIDPTGLTLTLDPDDSVNPEGPLAGIAVEAKKVSMTGNPELTFRQPGVLAGNPSLTFYSGGMIQRDAGSWVEDGFEVWQTIEIGETPKDNQGSYTIIAIDDANRTIICWRQSSQYPYDSSVFSEEGPLRDINITVSSGRSADSMITRGTGSWIEDGFRAGQEITVTGSQENNGSYVIGRIDPTGKILFLAPGSLSFEGPADAIAVKTNDLHGFSAWMGVLPYRVWDTTPGVPELTGAYTIDLLDNVGNGDSRLTRNELMAALPGGAASAGPIAGLLALTEIPTLTNGGIHLKLETDLPPGTAFPPYRMDLDISDWNFTVADSEISDTTPTIEFNNVQFELVGFMRDFAGAALTRLRTAFKPLDGLVDFLTSAGFPILSYFFGRTSYLSAVESFGGDVEIGDFAGASYMLRNLVDGGDPFDQGSQNWAQNWMRQAAQFLGILPDDQFGGYDVPPIAQLTGQAWIDIGSFTVDGEVARGRSSNALAPIESPENPVFGKLGDDDPNTIIGQIVTIAQDEDHTGRDAALGFIATQMLPGFAGLEQFYGGGLTQFIVSLVNVFKEPSIEPIRFPILSDTVQDDDTSNDSEGVATVSFDLLLGNTRFVKDDPEQSLLLTYGTPELRVTLNQQIPLNGKWWNELPGAEFIELMVLAASGGAAVAAAIPEVAPYLSINFESRADFELAFDTTGLETFQATRNPDDIVNGLFFDDREGIEPNPSAAGGNVAGLLGKVSLVKDEAQARILGGLAFGVYGELNFIGLKVGIEAGFYIGGDWNFNDPNGDGNIRAAEFDRNSTKGDANVFDEGVRLEFRMDVYVNLNPFGLFPLVDIRVNVVTFGGTIGLPHTDVKAPVLGEVVDSTLYLNIGDGAGGRASQRLYKSDVVNEELYIGYDGGNIIVSGFDHHNEAFNSSEIEKIVGYGGSGNDRIIISDEVLIPVELHGGGGNDILIVSSVLASGSHQLYGDEGADYIEGGEGNDILDGGGGDDLLFGWRGDDTIYGGGGNDAIDGGVGDDYIEGGAGKDVIVAGPGDDIVRGGSDGDYIYGGDGSDELHGDSGEGDDIIRGGLGNDRIWGGGGADEIFGGQNNDLIYGGADNDWIDGGGATDSIFGDGGDDLIVSKNGNDFLNGMYGNDTYLINFEGDRTASLIRVLDAGGSIDTDLFMATGTVFDDQFLLRANTDGSLAFVAMLNDLENELIRVERINYTGVERIVVNGDFGNDHFAVDDTAAEVTLNGEAGSDTFQVGQIFRSERTQVHANVSVEDEFATIETTRGFLSNGISAPMVINGGPGIDNFVVFHNKAVLSLNGDGGDDVFEVRAFALAGSQEPQRERTDISGGAGADLIQYAVNAPVNIDGGDGLDTLVVFGTEFGDDFVITENGIFGAGLTINFVNIELLKVDGAEGDDRFFVKSTSEKFITELFGGLGSDTFNMSGDTPPIVSNDLLGHSGIILHDVESNDPLFDGQKLFGISANVADNDEPFVVIRQTDGSTIITEGDSLIDTYEVVLTRQPDTDVFIKALAPIPTSDERELRKLAFRLSSNSPTAITTPDGTALTLTFTPANWFVPQVVEIRADGEFMQDGAGLFTRPELGDGSSFDFDDDAYEGVRFGVINHLVLAGSESVQGNPIAITDSPTIVIANPNNRLFHEFLGETITVSHNGTLQERLINSAVLVDGNMLLTVDRAWLTGTLLPDTSSTYEVVLDSGTETGNPLSITNSTVTIPDPGTDYTFADFLGRKVEIVSGLGAGQSRFIVGAELSMDLSETQEGNVFAPNLLTFYFDVSGVIPTGDALLTISALADLNAISEYLTLDAEGVFSQDLFLTGGLQYSPVTTTVNLSKADIEILDDDDIITFTIIPSPQVHDLDEWYLTTNELKLTLMFPADPISDISGGNLQLTVDRGWLVTDLPDRESEFLVRMDDAVVGTMTAFDESPDIDYAESEISTFTDTNASFPTVGEGLTGAILQIVGGPGVGQQRLILGNLEPDPTHTLILNGPWRTDPVTGQSIYRIERYDGLAIPSVQVQINDDDAAGLIIDETQGFENTDAAVDASDVVDDFDTITAVIEGGDGDHLGEKDVLQVRLSCDPGASNVNVNLLFDGSQLELTDLDGTPISSLQFTSGKWGDLQTVVVEAKDDMLREGFHASLVEFEITAGDSDVAIMQTDSFVEIPEDEAVFFVGLSQQPVEGSVVVTLNGSPLTENTDYLVKSNKVVFVDVNGDEMKRTGQIVVTYSYTRPGFLGAFTPPVLVRINDNDAPTVLVRESSGSTDVIEFDPVNILTELVHQDSYELVLTGAPTNDVTVTVISEITKTTRTGGIRHDEVQVEVSSIDPRVTDNGDGTLTVEFNGQNWDDPVLITVAAVDDDFVDGGDTKVFAPGPNTVSGILGPVFVEGGGGQGSLGIGDPVLLPGETNIKEATGDVAAISGNQLTVFTEDLNTLIAADPDLNSVEELFEKTVEVTQADDAPSTVGQFRLITLVSEGPEIGGKATTILTLNELYDLAEGENESGIQKYAITKQSLNFFVDESTQIDYMFVHDEDSPADSSGVLTSTRLSGLNMGPDLVFSGQRRPGGITYGDLEVLEINLGTGGNNFQVLGTHTREDGYQTWTFVNTGDDIPFQDIVGDTVTVILNKEEEVTASGTVTAAQNPGPGIYETTVTIEQSFPDGALAGQLIKIVEDDSAQADGQMRRILGNTGSVLTVGRPWEFIPNGEVYKITNEADGAFALNTQGGDDTVDASASTLPLVIFGGDGSDIITGGLANDLVFGDNGRVDYFDETGMIVTRLGLIRDDTLGNGEPNIGYVDSATANTLVDNDITFPTEDGGLVGLIINIINGQGAPQKRRIISNNEHTIFVENDWDEGKIPDDTSQYRISFIPEDQMDGVVRDPLFLISTHSDLEGNDTLFGEPNEDVLIGGGGDDNIDGGSERDLIFGDNVKLDRRYDSNGDMIPSPDFTSPRFRALLGTVIYDLDDLDQVDDATDYLDPTGVPLWGNWDIFMNDAWRFNCFGDDYIAGGADDDMIFGQLGDDTIQGDGSIAGILAQNAVNAYRNPDGTLMLIPSFEASTDGDDYIEGGGGGDVIFGNLGQDDIVGGNSNLFSLYDNIDPDNDRYLRQDGSDTIFGGAGTEVSRNNPGDESDVGYAEDADMVLGDNGNIFRLVGTNSTSTGAYLTFNYDDPAFGYSNTLKIIPRAAELLDYHIGGPDYLPNAEEIENDIGAADEIHGESGDDFIYGMVGDDIVFGEGQDDDIIGGYGNDWISGGTGDNGVLGDDGRIYTSRNGTAEPLYGIGDLAGELDQYIYTPGKIQQATINVSGELRKTVNLTPFKLGDPEVPQHLDDFDPVQADDIIFGGWGNDSLHGGDGDDAISGAEALTEYYDKPANPGDVLKYGVYRAGEFGAYDEYDPWSKVYWDPETGEFVTGGKVDFILNFDHTEGPAVDSVHTDGDDVIFGDLGNDWLVGGTGRDHMYGGRGSDLLNADDNLDTVGGANTEADGPEASYEDIAYGGAGRDVLIANTGGDRLIDWAGEFNSYIVPYAPFGVFTVSRAPQPHLFQYLYDLSWADGGDPTIPGDTSADPARRGEPEGELGLVTQRDVDWQEQTGAPADPQPGNIPGGARDILRSATFNSGNMEAFAPDSGVWTVESGALRVSAETFDGDAAAVFHVGEMLPQYFEIQATITMEKPTAGWKANSYVIFDYYSPTDFKFAGLNASIDKIQMGHRDETGWIVDVQSNMKIKPGEFYNILVAINGTTVTLVADNKEYFSHTFEPRVIDDWVYGLNSGMVGFGSNNARGVYDNIAVQVLPPAITLEGTEEFPNTDGIVDFTPEAGLWQYVDGRYDGASGMGGDRAISLLDLGLDHGLETASVLELEATLNTANTGGLVFDYYSPDNFKFAAIDASADQAVIGHYTSRSGWLIDAAFNLTIEAAADYTAVVALKGTSVQFSVKQAGAQNWQAMVGHVFNAVAVDGDLGLLSKDGESSFDAVTVKTNDPAFRVEEGGGNLMASSVSQESIGVEAFLTYEALAPIFRAVMERWTAFGINETMLARLRGVSFQIVDLDGLTLGRAVDDKVFIDIDGAGHGWFIDSTPYNDVEFSRVAKSKSAVYGDIDLLTVVMHELGHVLGLEDLNPEAPDMMSSTLDTGFRQLNIEAAITTVALKT